MQHSIQPICFNLFTEFAHPAIPRLPHIWYSSLDNDLVALNFQLQLWPLPCPIFVWKLLLLLVRATFGRLTPLVLCMAWHFPLLAYCSCILPFSLAENPVIETTQRSLMSLILWPFIGLLLTVWLLCFITLIILLMEFITCFSLSFLFWLNVDLCLAYSPPYNTFILPTALTWNCSLCIARSKYQK